MIPNRMKNLPGHVQPFICATQTLTVVLSHLEIRKRRGSCAYLLRTHGAPRKRRRRNWLVAFSSVTIPLQLCRKFWWCQSHIKDRTYKTMSFLGLFCNSKKIFGPFFMLFIYVFNPQRIFAWLILKPLSENSIKRNRLLGSSPLIQRWMVVISLFLTDKHITFSYCSAELLILNHIRKIKSCIGKRLEDLKEAKKMNEYKSFLILMT